MNNKTPHLAIIALIYGLIHFTQSGIDFIQRSHLGKAFPITTRLSEIVATMSAWLFVIYVLPRSARLILAAYDLAGRVTDTACLATRRQAARVLKWVLDHLDGNDPQ